MTLQLKTVPDQRLGFPGSAFHCLKVAPCFSNLTHNEISPFQNTTKIRSYKKGQIIYHQGDSAKFFYVIVNGWIKLFRTMPEGQEVIIDILTKAKTFGDDAIFEQELHACTAQVVEDVQLINISANLLKEQMRLNPTLALNMLAAMSEHHRRHAGALAFNAMLSAPQRVGFFLLRLCTDDGKKKASFSLPYEKSLIADALGMNCATFSRSLALLKRQTGACVNGMSVEIDSIQKLGEYVYGSNSGLYSAENV